MVSKIQKYLNFRAENRIDNPWISVLLCLQKFRNIWIFTPKIILKILGFQFYGFKNSEIFEFSPQISNWKILRFQYFWLKNFENFNYPNSWTKNDFCPSVNNNFFLLGCQECCDWILQVGIWLLIVSNFFVPFINWEEKEWNWLENDEWDLKNISYFFLTHCFATGR